METAMTLTAAATDTTTSTLGQAFGVGSVLATIGSLGYIGLNFVGSAREAYAHPLGVVAGVIATTGVAILALALMRWRTELPGWAVVAAAAGMLGAAIGVWFWSVGIVGIASNTDDVRFEELAWSPWLIFGMYAPKIVLGVIGFGALAVTGWRTHAIPRLAAGAFALAALLSLFPPHPPALLLASLGMFIISRRAPANRQ
jgi:hypothetical protein